MRITSLLFATLALAACKGGRSGTTVVIGDSGWQLTAPSEVDVEKDDVTDSYVLSTVGETSRGGIVFVAPGDPDEAALKAACTDASPQVDKIGTDGLVITCGDGHSWHAVSMVKTGDGHSMQCEWHDLARGSRDSAKSVCASLEKSK